MAVGCNSGKTPEEEDGEVNKELKGDVEIEGSSTVAPISSAAATAFKEIFPNVNVTVGDKGTGDGFKAFYNGETDISDASRPIKAGEMENCKKNNVEFIELPVAYDGLTVVVHPDLKVDEVTVAELKTIFSDETQPKKWNEVNPAWPDEEIKIFAPGVESGT
ncbi:MAG: substrate-binding domain-containing protein, partial [Planctomycetaceae bacterium]|nr:substrate-binding domain-containing protein [Planctomycetaceae bacterium]